MSFKTFPIVCIVILIFSVSGCGYEISVWPDDVEVTDIRGTHVINTSGDLHSQIFMAFRVPYLNFSKKHNNLEIKFNPKEPGTKPIRDISIRLCEPQSDGWDFRPVTGYPGECKEMTTYSISNSTRPKRVLREDSNSFMDYPEYTIKFVPENLDLFSYYMLLINYTTPNFIFNQGEYSVAWISFHNPKEYNKFENSLILPTEFDIPRFSPDADSITRIDYYENGKTYYKWGYIFEDAKTEIIWYSNDKELKKEDRDTQIFYTALGAVIGFFLSLSHPIFRKIINFGCLCYTKLINLYQWIITKFKPNQVVGNTNAETYHRIGCRYVDKIHDRNRKQFKNKAAAEKEGYKPCGLCNPDE